MEHIQFGDRRVAGFGVGDAWVALTAPYQLVKNTRYKATVDLPWYLTDALVTEKLTSKGFTNVTIDSPNKRVEATWSGDDQAVTLPKEITAVWRLEPSPSELVTPPASTPSEPVVPPPPPVVVARPRPTVARPAVVPPPPVVVTMPPPSPPADLPVVDSGIEFPDTQAQFQTTSAAAVPSPTERQPISFTRETSLPMTQEQRQAAIDAWGTSSGYVKATLPDGTAGFKGPSGDFLRANGMPYVSPAPLDMLEWIRAHQTPIAIGAVVVGGAIIYRLANPMAYARIA